MMDSLPSKSSNSEAHPSTSIKKGKKNVGGVEFTPELQCIARSILELELSPPDLTNINPIVLSADNAENIDFSFDDGSPQDWIPTTAPSAESCRSSAVRQALAPMSRDDANAALKSALDAYNNKTSTTLSLRSVKAMSDSLKAFVARYPGASHTADEIRNRLEKALLSKPLRFDVQVHEMSKEEMEEASKFEKRMYRLRMKAEENKYHRLTQNLEKPIDDDINVKSMTYAASIGLNMIVAPVSFGILVYFVSGVYLFPDIRAEERRPGVVNAGKVICGVVAGVMMMFIEMILFVIRSNEMDYYTTKKKKKNISNYGPFGSKENARVAQLRETTTTLATTAAGKES